MDDRPSFPMADDAEASTPGTAREWLGPSGPFVGRMPGFRVRESQIRMAEAVAEAIDQSACLLVEAATGIGKTYAYLVPALISGRRVVISTGTKPLQDQLFHRDLPAVCQVLARHPQRALLKGRNNYLCPHRFEQARDQMFARGIGFEERELLERVDAFARSSSDGDLTQIPGLADGHRLWPLLTSTVDNCLGSACPRWNGCFVQKARRRAQEAEIVVVNHHLLLADMALKDEGFGELLPHADVVIVDEAHQLADVAGDFFGVTLGSRALQDLARDLERLLEAQPAALDLREFLLRLEGASSEAVRVSRAWSGRLALDRIPEPESFERMLNSVDAELAALAAALEDLDQQGPEWQQVLQRTQVLRQRLFEFREDADDTVAWVEAFAKSVVLHRTPLDASRALRDRRQTQSAAWIFTSATLAIGEDFSHARRRLGLDPGVVALRLESPFDFSAQARLVLPQPALPDPMDPDFMAACIDWAWPLLAGNPRGGFFLFTSHVALRRAAELLRRRLPPGRSLLVQGEQSRSELLRRFEECEDAWLLGAQTFWEGVDLPGNRLAVVIIDKLPFAVPSDPVLQARSTRLAAEGGNPFMDLQLPMAILSLKQGIGRLIRGVDDVGVVALCDPRLRTRRYGRLFLESLPPFARVDQPAAALAFLNERLKSSQSTGESRHVRTGD